MITGSRKPLTEIFAMLKPYRNILIVGCGTCVTVCHAGGLKEAEETAAAIRLHRQKTGVPVNIRSIVVERQCENEYLQTCERYLEEVEVVLSLACGVGVQCFAQYRPDKIILPGLNTGPSAYPVKQGVWQEACVACGDCMLDKTAGICPIARCAKSMLNGPCGGSQNGKCEVNPNIECVWQLIYDRLAAMNKLELLDEIRPPKNWSKAFYGGPRILEREDVKID